MKHALRGTLLTFFLILQASAQINGAPTAVIGWNAGDPANAADGRPALYTHFSHIWTAIVGPDGLVLFADSSRIRRIAADGTVQTLLTSTNLGYQTKLAEDSRGDIYYTTASEIYKWTPGGASVKLGGSGGTLAKDGLAAGNAILMPQGLALDPDGNAVFSDYLTYRVYRIDSSGVLHALAGTGTSGTSGENGPAVSAQLQYPLTLAYDPAGNLLINDDSRLLKILPDGTLVRYLPASAPFSAFLTAFDAAGNVYYSDQGNFKIARMTPAGTVTAIAGTGLVGFSNGCGSGLTPAVGDAKTAGFGAINGLAVDTAGNLLVADSDRIRQITPAGLIRTIAGAPPSLGGDGGPASAALLDSPHGLAYDSSGVLYIADTGNNRIRKVALDGTIQSVAGQNGPSGDQVYNCSTSGANDLNAPEAVAVGVDGTVYIADTGNNRLMKLAPDGTLSRFAAALTLQSPRAIGVDAAGAIWVGDDKERTLKLAPDGTVLDTLPALRARSFSIDGQSNFYLTSNFVAYRVTSGDQLVTVAGVGYNGQVQATAAPTVQVPDTFNDIAVGSGVTRDGQGTIYNLAQGSVDLISAACHVYSLAASAGFSPTRGLAHIAVNTKGDVYASDFAANVIWKLPHLGAIVGELPTPAFAPGAAVFNAGSMVVSFIDSPYPIGSGVEITIRNLTPDAIVPGELIRVYGQCIGPFQPVSAAYDASGHVPTSLGGVQLTIGGVAVPLVTVQEGMVVAQTPYGMATTQSLPVTLTFNRASASTNVPAAAYRAGLFSLFELDGSSTALALNQDGSINSQSHPAPAGSIVALFGTGLGQTNPGGVDGLKATDISVRYLSNVQVTVGGNQGTVTYAGVAPGFIGMSQINVTIPQAPHGANAVQVLIGGVPFQQPVQIWVQ